MLELRPSCEHCDRDLPPDSADARICTYECTFCATCVDEVLHGVCPNCTGDFTRRPVRPGSRLARDGARAERHHRPVDLAEHAERLARSGALAVIDR